MRPYKRFLAAAVAVLIAAACGDESPTEPEVVDPDFSRVQSLRANRAIELAVIGDVPYSEAELGMLPTFIQMINSETEVLRTVHVGDIKQQEADCSDAWFLEVKKNFSLFDRPLVYTPGDNEWTDCHKPNAGNYNPLERLRTLRRIFFRGWGLTLGAHPMRVLSQWWYPENQMWMESSVVFVTLHQVGSNNDLDPWSCYAPYDVDCPAGNAPESEALRKLREREFRLRDNANRRWLKGAFSLAKRRNAAGVVIFMQADFWANSIVNGTEVHHGHDDLVRDLAASAGRFAGPVLLFGGDTHNFKVRTPFIGETVYGAEDAPNVTNIIVDRSIEPGSGGGLEYAWVRLRVDPQSAEVFSWENLTGPIP